MYSSHPCTNYFSTMNRPVVRIIAQELVEPAGETPSGNLPLSFMDKTPGSIGLVDSIHVFASGVEPAKVIREALAKALVLYYPLAGRFALSDDKGELEVACTGDGVWFVEAEASCRLEDVGHLQLPLMMAKEDLLPYPSTGKIDGVMAIMMQVTQFACGGFVVGLRSSHAISDGIGAAQILQAVAEIARGCVEPAVTPIWCRDAIPDPPEVQKRSLPSPLLRLQAFDFENFIIDVSVDQINRVKKRFLMETGNECSKFDVLTAKIWQSRVRAIKTMDPHANVHLGFAANGRHLMRGLLPHEGVGYYGNCAYPVIVTATCGKVKDDGSLVEVISLIRGVKAQLQTRISKLLAGDLQDDPFGMPIDYGFMSVSDWSRVGFSEIDYGWGEPVHVCPVNEVNFIASCVFLRPPAPKQGVRVIARCVLKHELGAFRDEMMALSTDQCIPADKVDDAVPNSYCNVNI